MNSYPWLCLVAQWQVLLRNLKCLELVIRLPNKFKTVPNYCLLKKLGMTYRKITYWLIFYINTPYICIIYIYTYMYILRCPHIEAWKKSEGRILSEQFRIPSKNILFHILYLFYVWNIFLCRIFGFFLSYIG